MIGKCSTLNVPSRLMLSTRPLSCTFLRINDLGICFAFVNFVAIRMLRKMTTIPKQPTAYGRYYEKQLLIK